MGPSQVFRLHSFLSLVLLVSVGATVSHGRGVPGKMMQPSCPTVLPESGAFVLGGSGKFAVLLMQREKTPGHHWVISRGYRGLVPESSSPGWLVTAEKQNPLQRAPTLSRARVGEGTVPSASLQRKVWAGVKLDGTEMLRGQDGLILSQMWGAGVQMAMKKVPGGRGLSHPSGLTHGATWECNPGLKRISDLSTETGNPDFMWRLPIFNKTFTTNLIYKQQSMPARRIYLLTGCGPRAGVQLCLGGNDSARGEPS